MNTVSYSEKVERYKTLLYNALSYIGEFNREDAEWFEKNIGVTEEELSEIFN